MVRISRDQFGVLADSIVFDEMGQVLAVPSVEVLREHVEDAERARV
jgi:hypothetical protein